MKPQFEAPSDEEVAPSRRFRRDTRTPAQRALGALTSRVGVSSLILGCACLGVVSPILTPLCLTAGVATFCLALLKHSLWRARLPFRLPTESDLIDYNDPAPGRRQFRKARGMVPIGNEWSARPDEVTGPELWLSFEDLLTHLLVLGTTGSGKTELLVSLLFSAGLSIGSGGIYVDPKGMMKLAAQIYVLSRLLGRDDDFRLMNFNTGAKQPGRSCRRLSNTTNPVSFGTPENISQTLLSLIPEPEGDNAVFAQSAQALMNAESYAIADLRDSGIPVSIATFREYLDPDKFVALAHDPRVKEANRLSMLAFLGGVQWREDPMWELVQERLRQPVRRQDGSLDVLSPAARGTPPQATAAEQAAQQAQILEPFYQQFGFARSYFNQLMNSLVDTYGHIYGAMRPEIDMPDIILQRRILVALLPALEKSPGETKNVGKLTLAMIRNAAATGLGSRAMGTLRDVIYSLPSAAAKPMPVITDEYPVIAVEGYELVLTQLRALGIVGAIGSQDFAGMTKGGGDKGTGPASAGQIVANTGLKLALRTADPRDTWELFRALAAEGDIVKASRFARPNSGAAHYSDLNDVDVRRETRIDLRDLQQQIMGEFHAFMGGRIVRGFSFYANPPLHEDFQLIVHEMLQVLPPTREQLDQRHGAPKRIAERLAKLIRGEERLDVGGVPPSTLSAPVAVFGDPKGMSRMETAMAAVCHWIEAHRNSTQPPPPRMSDPASYGGTGEPDQDKELGTRNRGSRARGNRGDKDPDADAQLAFSGVPEVTPGASGDAISPQEIGEAAARAVREIAVGLAADVSNIEQALGQDPHRAAASGSAFAEEISLGLDYPLAPTPEMGPETPQRLKHAIRKLVRGLSTGPYHEDK
jgi:intracellular multiplication protein IcmO